MCIQQEQDAMIYDLHGECNDEEGEPMLGWYWQFVNVDCVPTSEVMGPYGCFDEAATAAHWFYLHGG